MDDHRRTGGSLIGRRGAPLQIVRALRSGHWPTLLGAWLHFEVSFMVWLLVGALSIAIASELGLSATQKGLLVAVPLLSGALLRIPVGISSDRMGAKRTGLAILLCELAGLGWAWLGASSYLHMLLTGLLLGVAGASFAVALPLASRVYPPAHQGLAMGIAASANSGTVLAMWFAPRIAELTGWQGAFGVMAAPVLMTTLLFAGLVQSDRRLGRTGAVAWRSALVDVGRDPFMYWLCGLYAITFGGFVGLSSALPFFLHDHYAVGVVAAGSLTALCGLVGSLIRPLGGYVADRVGGLTVLPTILGAITLLLAFVGSLPALPWAVVLIVTAVAAMGFGNGVVFQVASGRFAKQMGIVSGVVGAAGGLGGFLLPLCLGWLKDLTGTFSFGFWLFAACAGWGLVGARYLKGQPRYAGDLPVA